MKILFISSGNIRHVDISPFIKAQGESLIALGHQIDFYPIRGKGIFGYLKNVGPLRKSILENGYDVLHAHYSLSGIVASLARKGLHQINDRKANKTVQDKGRKKPIVVVSLLGSDVNGMIYRRFFLRVASVLWDAVIVKSEEMKLKLGLQGSKLIPNGVNLDIFYPQDKASCRAELHLDQCRKYVLFAADPQRQVKNYPLAKAAFSKLIKDSPYLSSDNCELITLGFTQHDLIPKFVNACDVLILTSYWEGSPNIIKEAMACNCPIVSTVVGDVSWLFGDLKGHYLASADPADIASNLKLAIEYEGRTEGRDRIMELGLDSETVAGKLVEVYERVGSRE